MLSKILLQIQQDTAYINIPSTEEIVSELKNLTINDAITQITSGIVKFTLTLLLAVIVFYVGKLIINKIHKVVSKILIKRHIEASLSTFVLSLIQIVLYFILIITVISILGIETSSFIAIFASAGIAVGMALSGTLQNFAGGVLIILLKPYKVGDYIEAQGFAGTVKEIQIFHTVINTPDNKSIIIPNGGLSTGSINNYSKEDYRRVDWSISLEYGTDLEAAKAKIMSIIMSDDRIVQNYIEDDRIKHNFKVPVSKSNIVATKISSPPFVGIDKLSENGITIVIRAWAHSSYYWDLFYEINERLYNELPKSGFKFPHQQMDIHVHNKA